jgi:hypothetical protein
VRHTLLNIEIVLAILLGLAEAIVAALFAFALLECRGAGCRSLLERVGGLIDSPGQLMIWWPLLVTGSICVALWRHGRGGAVPSGLVWLLLVPLLFTSIGTGYGVVYMLPVATIALVGAIVHQLAALVRPAYAPNRHDTSL